MKFVPPIYSGTSRKVCLTIKWKDMFFSRVGKKLPRAFPPMGSCHMCGTLYKTFRKIVQIFWIFSFMVCTCGSFLSVSDPGAIFSKFLKWKPYWSHISVLTILRVRKLSAFECSLWTVDMHGLLWIFSVIYQAGLAPMKFEFWYGHYWWRYIHEAMCIILKLIRSMILVLAFSVSLWDGILVLVLPIFRRLSIT